MKKFLIPIIAVLILAAAAWFLFGIKEATKFIASTSYSCDGGRTIEASYYEGAKAPVPRPEQPPTPTGSVKLVLSDGRNLALPQTISASGIRYANSDESLVFWSKGDMAFITENGTTTFSNCVQRVK